MNSTYQLAIYHETLNPEAINEFTGALLDRFEIFTEEDYGWWPVVLLRFEEATDGSDWVKGSVRLNFELMMSFHEDALIDLDDPVQSIVNNALKRIGKDMGNLGFKRYTVLHLCTIKTANPMLNLEKEA